MKISSPAFADGGTIPRPHTCDGADMSPALEWSDVPAETKELALIADDPDAPGRTWVHWVIYHIPGSATGLPAGLPKKPETDRPVRSTQGTNDFRTVGYGGPCPPRGPAHRYYFKLYALDAELQLQARATKDKLLAAMQGHILIEAQLMGRYARA